jgi:hypothetical protein
MYKCLKSIWLDDFFLFGPEGEATLKETKTGIKVMTQLSGFLNYIFNFYNNNTSRVVIRYSLV